MIFEIIFFFIFGACVGSFLNCVIYRLEVGKSFLKGGSFCPKCKHFLGFWDLIPILSFIFLKGKCRYCKEKISLQYPLVEIFTAFSFVFGFFFFKGIALFCFLIFSCLLILAFVFDLKRYEIPDSILYSLVFVGFFFLLFNFFSKKISLFEIFLSLLFPLFFFLIIFFSKEKLMGWGDFYLLLSFAFFLGWPKIIIAIFLAVISGAVLGMILILLSKKNLKSPLPFAPFLFFAFFSSIVLEKILFDFLQYFF
jgi:leader peptidase (prepilin peptidase)/N-methyltransferase